MNIWSEIARLRSAGVAFVVVTLVSGRGSIPQEAGAKIVVGRDGLRAGTIGGGKIEARAIARSLEILQGSVEKFPPQLITWNLQRDIGMTCGGEMTLLFERHAPSGWQIAVFGAGHVAQALVPLLTKLECSVLCVDSRAEWVEKLPRADNLRSLCLAEPKSIVAELPPHTFFISLMQGHSHDVPVLEEIFLRHSMPKYIGVIGSEVKGARIRRELMDRGVGAPLVERLRCPLGLPIGNNQPMEIAISIAAELLEVRGRDT